MYRRGLLMILISQAIGIIILFALLAIWCLFFFKLVKIFSNDFESIEFVSIYDAGIVLFSVFGALNVIGLNCSLFARDNLNSAEKGIKPLNKALAQAAGVLGIFSNVIGAILIFKNMNSEIARFSKNPRSIN